MDGYQYSMDIDVADMRIMSAMILVAPFVPKTRSCRLRLAAGGSSRGHPGHARCLSPLRRTYMLSALETCNLERAVSLLWWSAGCCTANKSEGSRGELR